MEKTQKQPMDSELPSAKRMSSWRIEQEGDAHYITRFDDRNERYKATRHNDNFVNGVSHPGFIQQANWSLLREAMYNGTKAGDIWMVTYPKCGTTLMEQIVLLLINAGDASKLDPASKNQYNQTTKKGKVWVDGLQMIPPESLAAIKKGKGKGKGKSKSGSMTWSEFEAIEAPRVLKTHAPRHMFLGVTPITPKSYSDPGRPMPLAAGLKAIYVSRNAKDACVSGYYHDGNDKEGGMPFDAFAVNWMSGLWEHGRWSDHVISWRQEALTNPKQVLWVRYEDIVSSPKAEIEKIARFLEIAASDEVIAKTVHGSGFAAMKAQSGDAHHMRKGTVGDSRNHFSQELEEEFDAAYKEQMRGFEDPYADNMTANSS